MTCVKPLLASSVAALALALPAGATAAPAAACAPARASAASAARIDRALRSPRDLWGEQLLRATGGPTLARASRFLPPLLFARTSRGRPLTDSGRLLPAVRDAGGPAGCRFGRAPRRRRQPDRVGARRRPVAHGRRRRRALRLVPATADAGQARRRVAAHPRDALPRPLAGVVRGARTRGRDARQLRAGDRPGGDRLHAVGRGAPPPRQPARPGRQDVRDLQRRCALERALARLRGGAGLRGVARPPGGRRGLRARRGAVRRGALGGRRLLAADSSPRARSSSSPSRASRTPSGRCSSRTSRSPGATASATRTRSSRSRRASTSRRCWPSSASSTSRARSILGRR